MLTYFAIFTEAVETLLERPLRSAATSFGIFLGVASVVTTLGLVQSAEEDVRKSFAVEELTTVRVSSVADETPSDSELQSGLTTKSYLLLNSIPGVIDAGHSRTVSASAKLTAIDVFDPTGLAEREVKVQAVSPDFLASTKVAVAGQAINEWHLVNSAPVVIVDASLAKRTGLSNLGRTPTVFLEGRPLTVIGLTAAESEENSSSDTIYVPYSWAEDHYGQSEPEQLIISTKDGQAGRIAGIVPRLIAPDSPTSVVAESALELEEIRIGVLGQISSLLYGLGAIVFVIGALSVSATTLTSVLNNRKQIGIRRALGASTANISMQVLFETSLVGAIGGVLGSATSAIIILAISWIEGWEPTVDLWFLPAGSITGVLVGILAGAYPALKASLIEPLEALRD